MNSIVSNSFLFFEKCTSSGLLHYQCLILLGSDFLGGQNDIALFCDLAKNIKFENNTIYDQLLNEGLQANWREYCKGTVTEDEAMSNFYKYINEKYPTIVTP